MDNGLICPAISNETPTRYIVTNTMEHVNGAEVSSDSVWISFGRSIDVAKQYINNDSGIASLLITAIPKVSYHIGGVHDENVVRGAVYPDEIISVEQVS